MTNGQYRFGTRWQPNDDELERLIAETIGGHPLMLGALVVIEASNGFVTLTGIVHSELARRRADLIARAHGARAVHNRLRLESDIGGQAT